MRSWAKTFKYLSWLTQLGVSIVAPPLLCVWACWWLQRRFGLGVWVMILGILFGLGGSVSSAAGFYRMMRRQAERDRQEPPPAFNDHE